MNYDIEVDNFIEKNNLCVTELEKGILKLAILHGRIVTLQEDIKDLKEKIK